MHAPLPFPRRIPQRVLVAGQPGPPLTRLAERLASALDVPLVPLADLAGPADVARLAAFDGWVSTTEDATARAVLLERAEVVVHLEAPTGTLTGLVRRTLRRIRAEATPEVDVAWLAGLGPTHPGLELVRLPDGAATETWLRSLEP